MKLMDDRSTIIFFIFLLKNSQVWLTTLIQILIWDLTAGCIYVLMAVGLNMIFGVMKNRIYMISFGIGAALAAGTMFRILSPFTPYMGTIPGIMAFVVIIIGGLGSIPGAIIAGLLLGLVQNFTISYFGRRRRKLANVL
jgi:branched-subunit amino acid ABC-type transport system permease component